MCVNISVHTMCVCVGGGVNTQYVCIRQCIFKSKLERGQIKFF